MKKIVLGLSMMVWSWTTVAQNNEVLMTINETPVYKSDFEYIFNKNNKKENITKEDLDEYLDLFVKFKLKVTEAKALGLDTLPKLKGELAGYYSQLSRQYMVDNEITEQLIQEAYERMQKEIEASHILINVPVGSDTTEAYNKAMDVYKKANKGEDFAALAKTYSEGPSAPNGGYLGWFSGFKMVYRFEDAAFKTQVGEVSKPVRTRFGYHVIKVHNQREARPDVQISHILVHLKEDANEEQSKNAEKKINEIYQKLENGENFSVLAEQYSDDKMSAKKSGLLGWTSKESFFDEITEAAYSISDGEHSKPVKTRLGWHIIKRNNTKPIGTLKDNEAYIKSRINRDERGAQGRIAKVNQLKEEYNLKVNDKAKERALYFIEKVMYLPDFNPELIDKQKDVLFTFADTTFLQSDFLGQFFELNKRPPKQDLMQYAEGRLNGFISQKIMQYEKDHLAERYPEFKALMQEYTDGVLLFELTDQNVWSKAIKDTAGLKVFYEKEKHNFMWDERIDYDVLSSTTKKTAKKAYKYLKKGWSADSVANYLNKESQLNVQQESALVEVKEDDFLKGKTWEEKLYKPTFNEENKMYEVVNIKKKLPEQPKTLHEARGLITSKYQDYLEQKWVEDLKAKYTVNVNKDVLYSLAN